MFTWLLSFCRHSNCSWTKRLESRHCQTWIGLWCWTSKTSTSSRASERSNFATNRSAHASTWSSKRRSHRLRVATIRVERTRKREVMTRKEKRLLERIKSKRQRRKLLRKKSQKTGKALFLNSNSVSTTTRLYSWTPRTRRRLSKSSTQTNIGMTNTCHSGSSSMKKPAPRRVKNCMSTTIC